jgi:hypothetical protein
MSIAKRAAGLAASLALILAVSAPAMPAERAAAIPSAATIYLNHEPQTFSVYLIDGIPCFSIRDIALILSETSKGFDLSWNAEENLIILFLGDGRRNSDVETPPPDISAQEAKPAASVVMNGIRLSWKGANIGGKNYYPLDDFARDLDFCVSWAKNLATATIDPDTGYKFKTFTIADDGALTSPHYVPIPTEIPGDATPRFLLAGF